MEDAYSSYRLPGNVLCTLWVFHGQLQRKRCVGVHLLASLYIGLPYIQALMYVRIYMCQFCSAHMQNIHTCIPWTNTKYIIYV